MAAQIEQNVPATATERVGPYKLIREIGRGGMGAVYEAERSDGELRLRVAVKFVSRAIRSDFVVERFKRERQILANLNHPNICRLIDAGTADDGAPYLVMELIEGQTIDAWSRNHTARETCGLFRHVCDAVQHAHQNLIVHRDLKPGNILVTPAGEPKLLDFGIAKILDTTPVDLQNTLRALTPDYASPEQIEGRPITAATDIYGLGCVLYHLLTGKPPRRNPGQDLPPPASSLNPTLPADIDAILARAMQPEPTARYATARELGDELGRWLAHEPVKAVDGGWTYIARLFIQRNRWTAAAMAAVTLLLTIGAGYAWWRAASAQRQAHKLSQIVDETNLAIAVAPDARAITEAVKRQWRARQQAGVADAAGALAVASVLRTAGEYREAMKILEEMDHAGPPEPVVRMLNLQSALALDQGQLSQAALFAKQASPLAAQLDTAPGLALEVATQSALVDQHLGRVREARQTLDVALKRPGAAGMTREMAAALNRLASLLEDSGDLTQALKLQRSAIGMQPGEREYRSRMGKLLEASGERQQATQYYECDFPAFPPLPMASPAARYRQIVNQVHCAAKHRWTGNLMEEELALGIAVGYSRSLAAEHRQDRYAGLADAMAWSAYALVTQPRGDPQKARSNADETYVYLLKTTPNDAEILRQFAANRIALVRGLPASEVPSFCADGLSRLKATPHPAVALLARQLQQVCSAR